MICMKKVTKSCYLDTNILILLQNQNFTNHQQTKLIFSKFLKEGFQLFISSLVIDEYLYNTYRLIEAEKSKKLILLKKGFNKILKIPNINLVNPPLEFKKHKKIVDLMHKYNLKPRDAYHLFIMLENKIKYLATFDSDFDKVFEQGIVRRFE